MLSFAQARCDHLALRKALEDHPNEALAIAIWNGVVGLGGGDVISCAVADTTPMTLSSVMALDDVAAAYATSVLLRALSLDIVPADEFSARDAAELGWERVLDTIKERRRNNETASNHSGGYDRSFAWVESVSPDDVAINKQLLQRVGLLAARMFRTLHGVKARRVKGIPEEISGVTLGGDFQSLLPHEYALWRAGGALRAELAIRLTEGRAHQYAKEGVAHQHRGALVLVVDESGSMMGTRNDWAKAAMTALTWMAWQSRRPVKVIHFSTAVRTVLLPPRTERQLQRAQLSFLGGGTFIPLGLQAARREMEHWRKQGVTDADIVLISDGDDNDGDELLAELRNLSSTGYRLFGVAIETEFPEALREHCAEYVVVTEKDLDNPTKIPGIAGAI